MNSLPIDYLHLETGAILLFLAMAVRTEFGRAASPEYDVERAFTLRWLPLAFILISAALTWSLKDLSPFLGLELAAGLTLSLLHPVNALCFMVHLMILRPWEIVPGNQVLGLIPRFGVTLCLISWLLHTDQHKRPDWKSLRSVLFLIGFSAWLLASTVKAPSLTLAVGDWLETYFKTILIFGMLLVMVESARSVREVELTLVISSLSLMASGIYQYLAGEMTLGRLKMLGKLSDPNDMGAVIAMSLPFALVPVFEETTGPLGKMAGLLYAGAAAVAIWLTRSRGTMLALVAQYFVVRAVRSRKKARLGLILTAGFLAAGYYGILALVPRDLGEMEMSQGSRLTFWKSAVNMAVKNPILGVGYNQYPDNYMSYAVGTIYERGRRTAHSSWFLALGESGFPGFFLFCAFFFSVARVAWRDRLKRPAQLYAVAGYGVAMSFLSHTYSLYFYILMALVLASASIKEKKADAA